MSPGRDGVIIVLVDGSKKERILLESKDLLAELCSYRPLRCASRMPNN
jgi:hypothetical protein